MVRRPDEVFLSAMTSDGHEHYEEGCGAVAKMLLEGDEAVISARSMRRTTLRSSE